MQEGNGQEPVDSKKPDALKHPALGDHSAGSAATIRV
jgi:hypothetical protein